MGDLVFSFQRIILFLGWFGCTHLGFASSGMLLPPCTELVGGLAISEEKDNASLLHEMQGHVQEANRVRELNAVDPHTPGSAEAKKLHNMANAASGILTPSIQVLKYLHSPIPRTPEEERELQDLVSLIRRSRVRLEAIRAREAVSIQKKQVQIPVFFEAVREVLETPRDPHVRVLVVADPLQVKGAVSLDSGWVLEVMDNLATNATRHAFKGPSGILKLRAQVLERVPEEIPANTTRVGLLSRNMSYLVFEVSDNGVGMDAQRREKIFETGETSDRTKGRGLGLADVADVAAQHGGFVEVTSELGKGTSFRFGVPMATRYSEAHYVIAPEARKPSEDKRVVFIDDDSSVRYLGKSFLSQTVGKDAFSVYPSALAAVEGLRKTGLPKVAIVDLQMPHEDPLLYVRALKEAGIKVILISAATEKDLTEIIRKYGADAMLRKPLDVDVFKAEVLKLLGEEPKN